MKALAANMPRTAVVSIGETPELSANCDSNYKV